MAQRFSHHIYVIELSPEVWSKSRKFRAANPHFKGNKECLYVGITSKLPRERLDQHLGKSLSKKGYSLASSMVKKYGRNLRPSLFQHLNPLTKSRAEILEKSLAESLRLRGYAVWWN